MSDLNDVILAIYKTNKKYEQQDEILTRCKTGKIHYRIELDNKVILGDSV